MSVKYTINRSFLKPCCVEIGADLIILFIGNHGIDIWWRYIRYLLSHVFRPTTDYHREHWTNLSV